MFTLGIDSAFTITEAMSTVICDFPFMRQIPRKFTALILCIIGYCITTMFCTNWGFELFDCCDHYLSNYLLLLVGIQECFAVGWVFDAWETA